MQLISVAGKPAVNVKQPAAVNTQATTSRRAISVFLKGSSDGGGTH